MLNEIHKERLSAIDDILYEAIKAVFSEAIREAKPKSIETDDNMKLGEKFRAYEQAQLIVNKAFNNIKSYKISKKPNKIYNKGV